MNQRKPLHFILISLSLVLLSVPTTSDSAEDQATCTIPLELVNIGDTTSPTYKLGIYVGLGGGAPQLYEFDTGGAGFWAAYTSTPNPHKGQWWGHYTLLQSDALSNKYESGNVFEADLVTAQIGLYGMNSSKNLELLCQSAQPLGVAQIQKYSNSNTKKQADVRKWNNALKNGTPPLYGAFYGDFGATLMPKMIKSFNPPTCQSGLNSSDGVYSVLPQLSMKGSGNGFIVHVGKLKKNSTPWIKVGITSDDLKTFPISLTMNPLGALQECSPPQSFPPFPVTGAGTFSEQIVNANVLLSRLPSLSQSFDAVGLTLDSGAPETTIYESTSVQVNGSFVLKPNYKNILKTATGYLKSGSIFSVVGYNNSIMSNQLLLRLKTWVKLGNHLANVKAAVHKDFKLTDPGYVNTGIMFYTYYDVMFDLDSGVVRLRPVN